MKQALGYSVKVWLTCVLVGPLILPFVMAFTSPEKTKGYDPELVLVAIIMGSIFSLPSLAVFIVTKKYLTKHLSNVLLVKLPLTVIGLLLIYLPFFIIDGYSFLLKIDVLSRPLVISYAIVIIAGIWFYKLNPTFLVEDDLSINE